MKNKTELDAIRDTIHNAIGGDFTDESPEIEKTVCDLVQKIDWYHNADIYRKASVELIDQLKHITTCEAITLRADIAKKISEHKPFDIEAVRKFIANPPSSKYESLFGTLSESNITDAEIEREALLERKASSLFQYCIPDYWQGGKINFWMNQDGTYETEDSRIDDTKIRDAISLFYQDSRERRIK